jgi:iron-sulfur cluster assembly accessory protein
LPEGREAWITTTHVAVRLQPRRAWSLCPQEFFTEQLQRPCRRIKLTATVDNNSAAASTNLSPSELSDDESLANENVIDYEIPSDAVIRIQPRAMSQLIELRRQQKRLKEDEYLVIRMGVRSGGCSGLSYVMDFVENTDKGIIEDDIVDEYTKQKIRCVVDAKSMLYLFGLELDYSDKLIGGGFKFFNPNAEESCGCGSSFGV